jgi:hypothetical protein
VRPGDAGNALRAVLIGVALLATFIFFFVYPGHNPEPNHLPVGAVGPPAQVAPVAAALERGDHFDVRNYATEADARAAILDRELYGALVLGTGPKLLLASAASFQVASVLEGVATEAAGGRAPPTEDVRPLDAEDPRGTTINLTALPLSIVSILGALLLTQLAPTLGGAQRLAFVALFSVLGAVAAMLIVNVAIGALSGPFLGLVAVVALAILATASVAAGVIALIGPPGIMLSFLVFLMLGNPASGAASAPELLPDPWRIFGQFLPGGAGATALRNVAYFDGAALLKPLLVLAAFVALGALLLLVVLPRRGPAPVPGEPAT